MLTRRNFLTVAAGTASLFVAGCSGEKDEAPAADSAPEPAKDAPAADVAPVGNVLVAYFSATGNTEGVATAIAGRLGADVFVIEAADPYMEADLNYNDDASRTSVERADGTNPELAQVTPDGWADYDTVLLGYPIWWGEAAWPLRTFVEGNDFVGRPWCRSARRLLQASGARASFWLRQRAPETGARGSASLLVLPTRRRTGPPVSGYKRRRS